ncbi:MAG: sulfatase-like hydrolase/transferase [Marinifilaceae bacterium]
MQLKYTSLLVTPLLAVTCAAQQRPNVIVIHTDEHSFRTLGCYRALMPASQGEVWGENVRVETPNIDYLASQGALVTKCYATTPVSSPSRASFFTGYYPQQTDVVGNDIPLNANIETFGHRFVEAGYKTVYIGKWHLAGDSRPGFNPNQNTGFEDKRYMMNRGHYKHMSEINGDMVITEKYDTLTEENFSTDFWFGKATKFIEQNADVPFCCVISIPDPHGPNIVRAPYNNMYNHFTFNRPLSALKNKEGLPIWAYGNAKLENMAAYFGMVKCIDDQVGILLNQLRHMDLLQNTIIVFTSDHGDLCGEHGLLNKGVPLETSARVPFIVYNPARIPAATIVNEVMSVVDFTPTILSLANIPTTHKYAGRDCASLLTTGKAPKKWQDVIFMRGTGERNPTPERIKKSKALWIAAVTPRYKLIYSEGEQDMPWLTDLHTDPHELTNQFVNPRYKKVVVQLTHELADYARKHNDQRVNNTKIKQEMTNALNK